MSGVVPDRIGLHGLRGHGRHGVLDAERQDGQEFLVDVVLCLDTRAAAVSDELRDTVDYGALARSVMDIVEGPPAALIETLAQRIADLVLTDPRISEVEVTVHKPYAPVAVPFGDVTVRIVRRAVRPKGNRRRNT